MYYPLQRFTDSESGVDLLGHSDDKVKFEGFMTDHLTSELKAMGITTWANILVYPKPDGPQVKVHIACHFLSMCCCRVKYL